MSPTLIKTTEYLLNPDVSIIPTDQLVAIDFETLLDPDSLLNMPDLLSFAWMDGDSITGAVYDIPELDSLQIADLKAYFVGDCKLLAHNIGYELGILRNWKLNPAKILRGCIDDTMLMLHCIDAGQDIRLKTAVPRHLEHTDMVSWTVASKLTRPEYRDYNFQDSKYCLELYNKLLPEFNSYDLKTVYQMEIEVVWVVHDMSNNGIFIHRNRYDRMEHSSLEKRVMYEQKLALLAGRQANFNSGKDIIDILYRRFKIKPFNFTPKGQPKTDNATISAIASNPHVKDHHRDFAKTMLDYKKYAKLLSVYFGDEFKSHIRVDGRIYANAKQVGTRTGRFSYVKPNLQQIPSRGDGAELRACFTSGKGHKLICIDMSQIEYRFLAHYSQDKGLIAAYHSSADLHQATADMLGISRKVAKNINFGIIYGQAAPALAAALGITVQEAIEYLDIYFAKFPGIQKFKQVVINYAKLHGYIRTMSGRIRRFDKYHYADHEIERRAVNTLIQGSSADYMKLCMIRCHRELCYPSGGGLRMLMQVHDELIFEVTEALAYRMSKSVQKIIENSHRLSVPIIAVPVISANWLEAKDD